MNKFRKLLAIVICSVMLFAVALPFSGVKAAVGNWTINYSVVYNSGVFKLSGVSVNLDSDVIQSLQITYPSSVTYNEPALPSGWTSHAGTNTVNYQVTSNGDAASVTNFLNAITFSGTFGSATGNIQVELTDRSMVSMTGDDGKKHFYEYVKGTPNITWYAAYDGAKAHTYNGLTGYLATITSTAENDFVYNSLFSSAGSDPASWIGGTRYKTQPGDIKLNDPAEVSSLVGNLSGTDDWYWADGPEATNSFFTKSPIGTGGTSIGYTNWNDNQPDGIPANGEGCLQFGYGGANSKKWNDLFCDGNQDYAHGYIIEYSEYNGQVATDDNKTFSAPLPLPTPTPATANPSRTCQDDGYPAGWYWDGSACVAPGGVGPSTSSPSPTNRPVVSSTPKTSIVPSASTMPKPSASASPAASASASANASASADATSPSPTDGLSIIKVNGELYNILDKNNTILGPEYYLEHQQTLERFWAYTRIGVLVKDESGTGKVCILHLLIIIVAFIGQLIYNHKSIKDLERYYDCLMEDKYGSL